MKNWFGLSYEPMLKLKARKRTWFPPETLVQGEIKMQIRLTDLELKETTVSAAIRAPFNKAAYPAVLSSTYMTQLLISVHTVMMVRFSVALHAPRHAASASTALT